MSAAIENVGRGGVLSIRITGEASAAAAGLGAIANPEGVSLLILRTSLVVFSASAGAANLSAGVTTIAAAATDILNALAMNGVAANTCYNGHAMQNTAKTAITVPALWTPTTYITLTGSATTVGLDALLLVEYVRVDS